VVVKEISGSNTHHEVNKATFETYKQSLHLDLKATITVYITQMFQYANITNIYYPKMNILMPMSNIVYMSTIYIFFCIEVWFTKYEIYKMRSLSCVTTTLNLLEIIFFQKIKKKTGEIVLS